MCVMWVNKESIKKLKLFKLGYPLLSGGGFGEKPYYSDSNGEYYKIRKKSKKGVD
jgi:hypothetical protein